MQNLDSPRQIKRSMRINKIRLLHFSTCAASTTLGDCLFLNRWKESPCPAKQTRKHSRILKPCSKRPYRNCRRRKSATEKKALSVRPARQPCWQGSILTQKPISESPCLRNVSASAKRYYWTKNTENTVWTPHGSARIPLQTTSRRRLFGLFPLNSTSCNTTGSTACFITTIYPNTLTWTWALTTECILLPPALRQANYILTNWVRHLKNITMQTFPKRPINISAAGAMK